MKIWKLNPAEWSGLINTTQLALIRPVPIEQGGFNKRRIHMDFVYIGFGILILSNMIVSWVLVHKYEVLTKIMEINNQLLEKSFQKEMK